MQAKLPDINAAIVTHRQSVLISYTKNDFRKVVTSLKAIISLLPQDFQVLINSKEYDEKRKETKKIICTKCKKDFPINDLKITKRLYSSLSAIFLNQNYFMSWICPDCHKLNDYSKCDSILEKDADPTFYKVIPEPPIYQGIEDRFSFSHNWKHWFEIAVCEIEHQVSLYRTLYAAQNQEGVVIESDTNNYDEDES